MIRTIWHFIRTAIFYYLGLTYTVFINPVDAGTWKNYLGYLVLLLALFDTYLLVKEFSNKTKSSPK